MHPSITRVTHAHLLRQAQNERVDGSIERVARAHITKTALGTKVNLQGVIDAYTEGPGRNLSMFGPLVGLNDWVGAMTTAGVLTYNDFNLKRASKWLARMGIKKVHPAREYSVAVYFPLPEGADLKKFLKGSAARADEVSTHLGGPEGKTLEASWHAKPPYTETQQALADGKAVWVRMWWD